MQQKPSNHHCHTGPLHDNRGKIRRENNVRLCHDSYSDHLLFHAPSHNAPTSFPEKGPITA